MPERLLEAEGLASGAPSPALPPQPYPGLRSFSRNEAALFFGRSKSVGRLLEILQRTRFLAVLGPSGSGKSSLVRTGLFEALEGGLDLIAGSRWLMVDIAHPADRPFYELAASLLRATTGEEAPGQAAIEALAQDLRRGPRSLIEWRQASGLPAGHNLLILVDQFEEMFRSAEYTTREEVESFVDLLIESSRSPEAPIYVVMTMRSEYVGAGSQIHNLGETMTRGMYITPWMTRDECELAIIGPARLMDFSIEPGLVNRLLNDIATFAPQDGDANIDAAELMARQSDQLPLMQHLLNLLWREGSEAAAPGALTLRRVDYDRLNGLSGAMDIHAERVLGALSPAAQKVAEDVFRAIITGSSVAAAVRRPRRFGDLVAECGGDAGPVAEVVEAFRAPDCSFLTPPPPVRLAPDVIIDISHESIIRQWDRLRNWIHAEAAAADLWRLLRTQAAEYREGKGELLPGRTLELRERWWTEDRPNAVWADRYGGDFELVERYLEASRVEERRRVRRRLMVMGLVPAALAVTAFLVFGYYSVRVADAQRNLAEAARLSAEQDKRTKVSEDKARTAMAYAAFARNEAEKIRRSAQVAVANAVSRERTAKEMALVAVGTAEEAKRATSEAMVLLSQFRTERAVALIGNAGWMAGNFDADGMRDKAAATRAVLATGVPTDADPALLIRSWVISGQAEEISGQPDKAVEAFAEAFGEAERTRTLGLGDLSLRRARALADSHYASALMRSGRPQEALAVAKSCTDEVKEDGEEEGLALAVGCWGKVGLASAYLGQDFAAAFSEGEETILSGDNWPAVRTRLQFYLDHIAALKLSGSDLQKIRDVYDQINLDESISMIRTADRSPEAQMIDRDLVSTVFQAYAVDYYEAGMDQYRWGDSYRILDRATALRFPRAGGAGRALENQPDLLGQPVLAERAMDLLNSRIDFGDPNEKLTVSVAAGSLEYFKNSIDALTFKTDLLSQLPTPMRDDEARRIGKQLVELSGQLRSEQFGQLLLRYPSIVSAPKLLEENLKALCDALRGASLDQAACLEIQHDLEVGINLGARLRESLREKTEEARATSRERLWKRDDNEVALSGYDVVQYFALDKTDAPVKGDLRYAHVWQGAVWFFSSEANLARFKAAPGAFAPQYGGAAADWMLVGMSQTSEPGVWLIRDGKLYLFDDDERSTWDADMIATADREWSVIRDAETVKPGENE